MKFILGLLLILPVFFHASLAEAVSIEPRSYDTLNSLNHTYKHPPTYVTYSGIWLGIIVMSYYVYAFAKQRFPEVTQKKRGYFVIAAYALATFLITFISRSPMWLLAAAFFGTLFLWHAIGFLQHKLKWRTSRIIATIITLMLSAIAFCMHVEKHRWMIIFSYYMILLLFTYSFSYLRKRYGEKIKSFFKSSIKVRPSLKKTAWATAMLVLLAAVFLFVFKEWSKASWRDLTVLLSGYGVLIIAICITFLAHRCLRAYKEYKKPELPLAACALILLTLNQVYLIRLTVPWFDTSLILTFAFFCLFFVLPYYSYRNIIQQSEIWQEKYVPRIMASLALVLACNFAFIGLWYLSQAIG